MSEADEFSTDYSIHLLPEKLEYIDEMAKIFFDEWPATYHAFGLPNVDAVAQDMREDHARNEKQLPLLMLVIDKRNGNLVATVGLEICDVVPGNPYYKTTPWLACTYTKPEYRGKGIAKQMINHILRYARQLGFTYVWLWTETARGLFEKLGFHVVENVQHADSVVTVMRIDFDKSNY